MPQQPDSMCAAFYKGGWENDMRHGTGRELFSNGDVYDGEFVNDTKSGQGRIRYKVGGSYEGLWDSDKRHGIGTLISADGNIF